MKNAEINVYFCCDAPQYFPGAGSRAGWEGPFLGAGDNEAEAYQDAADYCAECIDGIRLPSRRGKTRRGISAYVGRSIAAENRKAEDDDRLQIYCILYVQPAPEGAQIKTT